MDVYIYAADIYCKDCGEDEELYNSDEFPKGPYPDGGGEADCPQHCGENGKCINAITLSDGVKIGVWLGNKLTADGVEYVRKEIAFSPGNKVSQLWAEWYSEELSN